MKKNKLFFSLAVGFVMKVLYCRNSDMTAFEYNYLYLFSFNFTALEGTYIVFIEKN